MYPGCPSPFFCKSAYIINQSFLEQVSQCSTITPFRVYFTASCKISLCGTFMQRGAFMTRPQKGESLIKTKGVHLRMSETEYEILSEKAIATNMSISDFIEKETPRREICLCLFAHYNRQRFHSLPKFPLNRYPTPRTVCIYTGCPGSSSIFSLMLQICRITTL